MVVLATWHCVSRYLDLSQNDQDGLHSGGRIIIGILDVFTPLASLPWLTEIFCVEISCHQVASAFDWEGALEEGATRPAYLVGETQQIFHPP